MEITKIEAAIRQLEMAIILFTEDKDVLSIHTLVSAAGGILRDIGKKSGKNSFLEEVIDTHAEPAMITEIIDKIKEPKNFLKHANKDPNNTLIFRPERTIFDIWNWCLLYKKITGNNRPLFLAYEFWFYSTYPQLLKDPDDKIFFKKYETRVNMGNKQEILKLAKSFNEIQKKIK